MKKKRLLHLFCILFIFLSCQTRTGADYYEADGMISIHAGKASSQSNWKTRSYHTSVPMISREDTSQTDGTLSFSFFITRPGEYALWVMSAQFSSDPALNFLPFRIEDEDGFLLETYRLNLNNSSALRWLNESHADERPVVIEFPEPGHYTLRFESRGEPGYIVDRLHLTLNNQRAPEGMGLPETLRPDTDPLLAKRDEPVVLPPAWAFGTILEGTAGPDKTTEQIRRLTQEDIPLDGVWLNAQGQDLRRENGLQQLMEILNERIIRWGLTADDSLSVKLLPGAEPDFIYLEESAGPGEINKAYEATQPASEQIRRRGLVLGGLRGLHDPDFKKYPTRRIETVPEWSQAGAHEAGLKEAIEQVANPHLSTYEVPFLAVGTTSASVDVQNAFSEELFLRWFQFAAFNPVMTISSSFLNDISEDTERVKELFQMRNRLFPYIYSQAHRVRATGEKPVTGDGIHSDQFMFGDAFLVAPVYEPGSEQRQVYFPEGRWYDYWDGSSYEGNQSWFVESAPEKIPLFVKVGSIIPYRDYSDSVTEGTNQQLTLEVYTGGVGTFRLYEDDGQTMSYSQGEFATTAFRYFEQPDDYSTFTIGAVVGSFEGQVSDKQYTIRFKHAKEPAEIEANGQVLKEGSGEGEWYYESGEREVVISWVQPNRKKTDFVIQW